MIADPPPSVAQRFSDVALVELKDEFVEHIRDEKVLHDQQVSLQQDHTECIGSLTKRVEALETQARFTTLQLQTVLTKMDTIGIQLQSVLNIVEQSKGAWKVLGIIGSLVIVVGGFLAWAFSHLTLAIK